jgi:hypothetical protein
VASHRNGAFHFKAVRDFFASFNHVVEGDDDEKRHLVVVNMDETILASPFKAAKARRRAVAPKDASTQGFVGQQPFSVPSKSTTAIMGVAYASTGVTLVLPAHINFTGALLDAVWTTEFLRSEPVPAFTATQTGHIDRELFERHLDRVISVVNKAFDP